MITADCAPAPGAPVWRVEDISGIRVHWTPVAYDNTMSLGQRMRSFVRFAVRSSLRAASIRSDVVFATSTPLTIALPGLWASWRNRTPLVFEVRDLWPDVPIALGALRNPVSRWLALKLEDVVYRHSQHIVALAPGMREDIVAKGVPAEKVSVISNGADVALFSVGDEAGAEIRAAHEWLGDRPMIIYAGAVSTANGVEYLAHLAAATRQIDPEIRFVVAGTGRDMDLVRDLATELGVYEQSFFMLGRIPKGDVAKWLAASSMTCAMLTGPRIVWKDAVSNKFFDSLAAGKPVANNFDGFSSQVAREAGAGIILDPDDVEQAARDLV
ncbi:MAG: glycosyltransferase family 4 protein, partial [Actinobacteria bacterium]